MKALLYTLFVLETDSNIFVFGSDIFPFYSASRFKVCDNYSICDEILGVVDLYGIGIVGFNVPIDTL